MPRLVNPLVENAADSGRIAHDLKGEVRSSSTSAADGGTGDAHHLVNRSGADVVYLEIGDRTLGDAASYPDDDIVAIKTEDGTRKFTRKDGTPY